MFACSAMHVDSVCDFIGIYRHLTHEHWPSDKATCVYKVIVIA